MTMPPMTDEERQALIDAAIQNEPKRRQEEKRRRDQDRMRRQAETPWNIFTGEGE